MDKEYIKIGETSEYEAVYKAGLVFNDGKIYSVERHQGKKGTYTTKEDVTKQIAMAVQKELNSITPEVTYGKRCSKCGAFMKADTSVVYTSSPPMYMYHCPKCGNNEYGLCSENY